ncbi:MAG: isoprenylcysteine carboxylmethyltransferase family protein [Pyrinomonadaceae bacterium]|nr:isoprenylcysteine carboxylmethyltransferase family protein [Pyrinomonadaceae bacterium]
MKNETTDNPNVVAPPPLIYLATLVLGLVLNFLFPLPIFAARTSLIIIGLSLISVAAIVIIAAFRAMALRKTNVEPWKPTTAIVSDGVFGFSRNPIYLSMTLLYFGIALLLNSLWLVLLTLPLLMIVTFGVILREEKYLESKFGAEYTDYKNRVRRWL